MTGTDRGVTTYDVIYRATIAGGKQAEVRLQTTYARATLADAWGRLTALHEGVDPRSIEIELRQRATRIPSRWPRGGGARA